MKRAACLTILATVAAAMAEPLNPAYIGAGARWVAHVDVDRAREAEGLRRLLRGEMDLDAIERMLCVDISELNAADFSFISAYGNGDGGSEVAVIGGSPRLVDWFAGWMGEAGEARPQEQVEQWTVRSWVRAGQITAMTTVDLPGDRVAMVLADSADEVVAGARVVAGTAPGLAEATEPLLTARPATGSVVFIAAAEIDEFSGLRRRAMALQEARRLTIDIGEAGESLFLSASLTATGPDQAASLRDLFSGLRAWARMTLKQSARADALVGFLDDLTMRVDGAELSVSWSAPVPPAPAPEAAPEAGPEPAEAPPPR